MPFTAICPPFALSAPISPALTATELRFVCGDKGSGSDAWKSIPVRQAQLYLKNFLQDRGFHHPTFTKEKTQTGEDFTLTHLGAPTYVTALSAKGGPPGLKIHRMRNVVGELLTPQVLGLVEKWTLETLRSQGYPCPTVRVWGDPESGEIVAEVEPGDLQVLGAIEEDPIPDLLPGTLRRYDAMHEGEVFNGDLLRLTEDRIAASGVVQSIHFSSRCKNDEQGQTASTAVQQKTVSGQPRVVSVGAGINTEGVILGRLTWKSVRLGNRGSSLNLSLKGSWREQRFDALGDWYALPGDSRFQIRPGLTFKHENESSFESLVARISVSPGKTWDRHPYQIHASAGPALDLIRTLRGFGPTNTTFLSFDMSAGMQSHDFEYFQNSPRSGFNFDISSSWTDDRLASTVTAKRLHLQSQALWNVAEWDPPLLVLGLRAGLATVFTDERLGPNTRLPPTFAEFLGGSGDLRGFGRKELPDSGQGALTSMSLGFEARFPASLPLGLEPIVFCDFGKLGTRPLDFDPPWYFSPGLGIRWPSPIGVFRFTLAHGFQDGAPKHLQFYFGYGEEF